MAPNQPNLPPSPTPLPPPNQQPYYVVPLAPGFRYVAPPLTNKLALASMVIGLTSVGLPLLLEVLRYAIPNLQGITFSQGSGSGMPYYFVFALVSTLIGLLAIVGLIISVVLGHIALGRVARFPWLRATRGQALTGLIAGYAGLALQLVLPVGVVLVYGIWHASHF